MSRIVPFIVLALASCADPASDSISSGPPASEALSSAPDEQKGDSFGTPNGVPPGTTVRLQIDNGAFPYEGTRPNVVVYVPAGFDAAEPFGVVVFLHGWFNCADNVIRPKNGACVPGRAPHNAYNLGNQLEASKRNALLIVPELMFEAASSDPGRLAEDGVFYDLLDETMSKLADETGGLGLWDISTIAVMSHSGGYRAAAGIVSVGGLWVDELYLLDSLYGQLDHFDAFVQDDLEGVSAEPPTRRFASVYSRDGGALKDTQAMAKRAAEWGAPLIDDRTTATLTAAQFAGGLLFKRTGLGHDDIPRYYVARLLSASNLPAFGSANGSADGGSR